MPDTQAQRDNQPRPDTQAQRDNQPRPGSPPKHDATYKSFFAHRRVVEDTLRAIHLFADTGYAGTNDPDQDGGLAGRLDMATLKRLPASFVTKHLGRRSADMLWSVRARGEDWDNLLVLFEFQSTVDRRMAFRMMSYASGIWLGLDSSQLGPGREFPFVLPVVVYNGQPRWTAPADVHDLLAPAPGDPVGSRPRHPYYPLGLRRLDLSRLPMTNALWMIVALEQARSLECIQRLGRSLPAWVERAAVPEKLLPTFEEWTSQVLLERLRSEGGSWEDRIRELKGVPVTTLIERARQWGQELNQEWLEKGIEQGLEKGIERGLEKGRSEGRLQGERELVRRQVGRRYGPEAAAELGPLLDAVADQASIAAIGDAVVECDDAEEFRARVAALIPR